MPGIWDSMAEGFDSGLKIGIQGYKDAQKKKKDDKLLEMQEETHQMKKDEHEMKIAAQRAAQKSLAARKDWMLGDRSANAAAKVYNTHLEDGQTVVPGEVGENGIISFYKGKYDENGNAVYDPEAKPVMQFQTVEQMQKQMDNYVSDGKLFFQQEVLNMKHKNAKKLQDDKLKHDSTERAADRTSRENIADANNTAAMDRAKLSSKTSLGVAGINAKARKTDPNKGAAAKDAALLEEALNLPDGSKRKEAIIRTLSKKDRSDRMAILKSLVSGAKDVRGNRREQIIDDALELTGFTREDLKGGGGYGVGGKGKPKPAEVDADTPEGALAKAFPDSPDGAMKKIGDQFYKKVRGQWQVYKTANEQ